MSRRAPTARRAAPPSEPSQTSNRAKKAARESVQARLSPSLPSPASPETRAGKDSPGKPETGRASWYDLSTKTASGEAMDGEALTAAHNSLPLGSQVRVENLDNGRVVVVRINDRGPFAKDRIIDLSKAAADAARHDRRRRGQCAAEPGRGRGRQRQGAALAFRPAYRFQHTIVMAVLVTAIH